MQGHSFQQICVKFGMWNPYTLQMVMEVNEGRSSPRARATRAVYTQLQMSGELRREIRN